MRAWVCVAACLVVVVSVAGQHHGEHQGRGKHHSHGNTNPRLGLVATDIGVPPVPGGNPNGNPAVTRQELQCFCLPVNQECPYDKNGRPIGIVTRIQNEEPLVEGECVKHLNRCCKLTEVTEPDIGDIIGICGGRIKVPNYLQPAPAEADFGEYPWMAVILDNNNRYLGGGVLIREQWVLTAAHKITTRNVRVRLGDYDLKSSQDHPTYPHVDVGVKNIIIHPRFNESTLTFNVALLQLERPINVNSYRHIGLACLPNQGQKFEGQDECFVSGWGKDSSSGRFQNILKEVDVPIVESFTCQARLRNTRLGEHFILDSNSFLCAGGKKGKDACSGDGGSPLVCPSFFGSKTYTVVGLVAWGIGCGEGDVPGVYVNVANFVNYIEGYVGPLH